MTKFYGTCCKIFDEAALPLTDLIKKDRKFEWNDSCQTAFDIGFSAASKDSGCANLFNNNNTVLNGVLNSLKRCSQESKR